MRQLHKLKKKVKSATQCVYGVMDADVHQFSGWIEFVCDAKLNIHSNTTSTDIQLGS